MSNNTATTEEIAPPRKKKKSGLFWLIMGGLAISLPGASFILITGMIPTIVMFLIERRKPRYITYCVGSFNFVGTLPYFLLLCEGSQSFKHALEILGTPLPWIVMYGASSIGLAIFSVIPSAVKIIRYIQLNSQIEKAEKQRAQIITDWGDKIKEAKPEE